jgi:MFS family permease
MISKEPKKAVKTFAWASFLNDLGSDMIYPVWPLFVTSLGADMAVLGFLDGLGDAMVSLSQALSGYLSDRIQKRKVFVWAGYLMGALSRIGYAFSFSWVHLIFFRILDRAGKIRSAPRDAIIADLSTKETRGHHFGLLRMMDNLGAVAGILICILLINRIGYKTLFLIAAIPSAAGAFLIGALIRETKSSSRKIWKGYSLKYLDRNCILFFFLNGLFAVGAFSYSFLLLFPKKFGIQIGLMPLFYLIFTLFAAIFSLPFGRLADKIGRRPVLFLSFLLWILTCLDFVLFRSRTTFILGFVLYGLHKAAMDPVQKTFVAELAPKEFRASTLGAFQMVIGLCALPASVLAGVLWEKAGISYPFFVSLLLTTIASILLLFIKEPKTT